MHLELVPDLTAQPSFGALNSLQHGEAIPVKLTGFAKRGLPHTSNSMSWEDHNLVFKKDTNLNFFSIHSPMLVLTIDQSSSK